MFRHLEGEKPVHRPSLRVHQQAIARNAKILVFRRAPLLSRNRDQLAGTGQVTREAQGIGAAQVLAGLPQGDLDGPGDDQASGRLLVYQPGGEEQPVSGPDGPLPNGVRRMKLRAGTR